LQNASEKIEERLLIAPKNESLLYNLACVEGLRGNVQACLKWLRRWKKVAPASRRMHIANDLAFEKVRGDPDFIAFLDSRPD